METFLLRWCACFFPPFSFTSSITAQHPFTLRRESSAAALAARPLLHPRLCFRSKPTWVLSIPFHTSRVGLPLAVFPRGLRGLTRNGRGRDAPSFLSPLLLFTAGHCGSPAPFTPWLLAIFFHLYATWVPPVLHGQLEVDWPTRFGFLMCCGHPLEWVTLPRW
jgi:hypothetical protein